MSKQIYLVYILPLMATTDMCVILCILMNHKCTKEDIDGIDVDENGPPEHIWDNIELSEYYFRLKDALVGILFHHPYIPLHYIWFKVKGVIPATTNWLTCSTYFFSAPKDDYVHSRLHSSCCPCAAMCSPHTLSSLPRTIRGKGLGPRLIATVHATGVLLGSRPCWTAGKAWGSSEANHSTNTRVSDTLKFRKHTPN